MRAKAAGRGCRPLLLLSTAAAAVAVLALVLFSSSLCFFRLSPSASLSPLPSSLPSSPARDDDGAVSSTRGRSSKGNDDDLSARGAPSDGAQRGPGRLVLDGSPVRVYGRGRRATAHATATRHDARGVRGLARDCGAACRLRLRDHDGRLVRLHLRRMHVYEDDRANHGASHFVPIVQFIDSANSSSARSGRVPFECIYTARVDGVHDSSVVNLCEAQRGIFGLLALPEGVFTVEPVHEGNETGDGRQREHSMLPAPRHVFHPPRLHFDTLDEWESVGSSSESNSESLANSTAAPALSSTTTPNPGYNFSMPLWQDTRARRGRSRRAADSWDYHVEVLVVADAEMYRYHGRNLENYLLTLFSTVASIYRHETLRAAVNVVVVKIIILKHEHSGPRVTSSAQETLMQFCRWQRLYQGSGDEDMARHDVAILLTRGDICRSPGKCDTLGLAELGTMCDRDKSCAIIEDNGLSAAFTIAHELGHIFNVPHDDERKCAQFMPLTKNNFHIMAPTLEYNTHPWSWSPCSAALLDRFLDNNKGQIQCLINKPYARQYYDQLFDGLPPGRKYDVNQQCQFVFGADAVICPYMPACRRLWCSVSYGNQQGCRTQHMPWADGTPCQSTKHGGEQFCHRGECVGMAAEYSVKQDGAWGEWQSWGRCSRTCGGGIQKSARDCNNPAPSNGGKYCTGQRERYRSCAIGECPWDTPPFRDVQCAEYNGKDTGIYGLTGVVSWLPKYGVADNERCKLYCKVDNSAAFHLLKDKVIDGTPCDQYGNNLCVDGTCMPAGCDRVLGSSSIRDHCGVCNGDGSTCELVRGTFNERGSFGYNDVMKIPAGSANIDIRQHAYENRKEDDNYLALRSADGAFLLNGHYQVSVYRMQIPLQDTVIEYSGSDHVVERINATGPLRTDVYVHVLSVGALHPPDIRYEYQVPRGDFSAYGGASPSRVRAPHHPVVSSTHFMWRADERWSECSAPCQGRQTQQLVCVDGEQRPAPERQCANARPPTPATRMCNIDCTLRWMTEETSPCSAHCGAGTVRLRVFCARMDSAGRATPVQNHGSSPPPCPGPPPAATRACFNDCSGRRWVYSAWSACSESCGEGGSTRRSARCTDDANRSLDDSYCAREARQETERECNRIPCPRWVYEPWKECSRSCDGGVRQRHASCVDAADRVLAPSYCPASSRVDRERCNEHECTWWTFSEWSACSVSCGVGVHTRTATCTSRARTNLENDRCDIRERIVQKPCTQPACPAWKTSDWSACSVSCGEGWSTRRVTCKDAAGEPLEAARCGARPSSHQPCNQGVCPFWRIGDWTACTVSCGDGGVRRRSVECVHREATVDHSFCGDAPAPTEQKCHLLPCSAWSTSEWSACSVTCGVGSQERRVYCSRGKEKKLVDDAECDRHNRPRQVKRCERECLAPAPDVAATAPRPLEPPAAAPELYWASAPWGACSTSCGEGVQRRQVVCRERGEDVAPARCAHLERVDHVQPCSLRPCARWQAGEWQTCPVTCGVGVEQTRAVACVLVAPPHSPVNETDACDAAARPDSARACQPALPPCPTAAAARPPPPGHWKTQPWSKCSKSCGTGYRRRHVVCERALCVGDKPKTVEVCNKNPCPLDQHAWQISPWTTCSATCGAGEQRRTIWCEHSASRQTVNDAECPAPKPPAQRDCMMPSCAPQTEAEDSSSSASLPPPLPSPLSPPGFALNVTARLDWSAGPWSACSARCGRGTRSRNVTCVDVSSGLPMPDALCVSSTRPKTTQQCRSRCARWKTLPWGECSVTCGRGTQRRVVQCARGRGAAIADDASECAHLPRPAETSRCVAAPCPAYRWHTTPWSLCTDPCSGAPQTRRVYCMSSLSRRAAERMCAHDAAPVVRRNCSTDRCPYHWVPTPWNTCSKTCGAGTQLRAVECRVRPAASTLLSAAAAVAAVPREKCSALPLPPRTQSCQLSPCNADFHWQTSPWQPCSATCGPGVRRRRVRCLDAGGRRASRSSCAATSPRPPRTQTCFVRNCLPSTCQEMRAAAARDAGASRVADGNYTLLLDGFPIVVYCARMNETIPRAYINLNRDTNFAEVYGKRLVFPHTCPYEGRRNDSCLCTADGDSNAGKTFFSKIRVDLLNRKININDFAFAETVHGNAVSFATAGDCYSMKDCPQGRFSVDLRGTGVRVVDDLQWEDSGHRTSSRIERSQKNTLIEGECGGYCGKCAPDKYKGLVFEVLRPDK